MVVPVGLSGLLFFLSIAWFGSFAAVKAAAAGRNLFVHDPEIVIDDLEPFEERQADMVVQNLTPSAVEIIGTHSTCTCSVVAAIPVVISAWSTRRVPVHFTAPEGGRTEVAVTLYTKDIDQQVSVRIVGVVK